ncbi:hypothetical protein ACOZ38_12810 [Sphaerisporangium viridialbum]
MVPRGSRIDQALVQAAGGARSTITVTLPAGVAGGTYTGTITHWFA